MSAPVYNLSVSGTRLPNPKDIYGRYPSRDDAWLAVRGHLESLLPAEDRDGVLRTLQRGYRRNKRMDLGSAEEITLTLPEPVVAALAETGTLTAEGQLKYRISAL